MNIYWEEHENIGNEFKPHFENFNLVSPPREVGGYDITGGDGKSFSIMFMMRKKPNWFHRKMTRLFLGWSWVDKK